MMEMVSWIREREIEVSKKMWGMLTHVLSLEKEM